MNISGNTFTGETRGMLVRSDGLCDTANRAAEKAEKAAKKAERYNLWAMIISVATSAVLLGMAISGVLR